MLALKCGIVLNASRFEVVVTHRGKIVSFPNVSDVILIVNVT